jgi:hypothetical protein
VVIEKLKRDYQYSILFFVFIELMLLLVFAFITMTFEGLFSEGLIILIIGSLGLWLVTIFRIRDTYKRFMKNQHFRVHSLNQRLNYPLRFHKTLPIPLFIWGKAYLHKKMLIPKCFIGFTEGHRVYPIKEMNEIPLNNHVEILYIHKGYAALVQDREQKKYLIHLDNLQPIE